MSLPLVTAIAKIEHGRLVFENKRAFNSAIQGLKHGTTVEVVVQRLLATRSSQANRYYWGVVIAALSDHTGYRAEELHELLKQRFLPKEYGILNTSGDVICEMVMGGSTRQMKSDEFATYVNQVIEWAGADLGVYIPSPNEQGYGHGI